MMIQRAINAGVTEMMMPNISPDTVELMWDLVNEFQGHCYPMIGLHPCSVAPGFERHLESMFEDLQARPYVGIGETGVDLYWDTSTKEIQIAAFEEQINWGLSNDLPVIIHSRESLDLTISIIEKHQNGHLRGIFHCFGGSLDQAHRIHAVGFKAGIGGVLTFKNSSLASIIPEIPPEMLVLETDAPYLAPVPYRGKRNEPGYITVIAETLARHLQMDLQQLAILTSRNASEVFRKKG
jgi:TatD DNase family protein